MTIQYYCYSINSQLFSSSTTNNNTNDNNPPFDHHVLRLDLRGLAAGEFCRCKYHE